MNRTLFAISDDLLALDDLLTELGGDVTDAEAEAAVDEWLESLGSERDAKLDAYCAVIREIDARAAARSAEAARIMALAEADEREAKRLRDRLHAFLSVHQIDRIDTARGSMRVQKNGGKAPLVIDNDDALPPPMRLRSVTFVLPVGGVGPLVDNTLRLVHASVNDLADFFATTSDATGGLGIYTTEEIAANKLAIRAALEAGETVDGAHLGERSTRLVIK